MLQWTVWCGSWFVIRKILREMWEDKRIYGLINGEKLLIKANAWHWKWRWRRQRRFHIANEAKRNETFRINSVNERQDFFTIHVQWMNRAHRGVNTSKTYTATITLTLAHGITFYVFLFQFPWNSPVSPTCVNVYIANVCWVLNRTM